MQDYTFLSQQSTAAQIKKQSSNPNKPSSQNEFVNIASDDDENGSERKRGDLKPENLLKTPSVFSFFATLAFIRPDMNEILSLLQQLFLKMLDVILFDIEKEIVHKFPKEQVIELNNFGTKNVSGYFVFFFRFCIVYQQIILFVSLFEYHN